MKEEREEEAQRKGEGDEQGKRVLRESEQRWCRDYVVHLETLIVSNKALILTEDDVPITVMTPSSLTSPATNLPLPTFPSDILSSRLSSIQTLVTSIRPVLSTRTTLTDCLVPWRMTREARSSGDFKEVVIEWDCNLESRR